MLYLVLDISGAISGASGDVLQLTSTGMYSLNAAVHTSDSHLEVAHAVDNIRNNSAKVKWQNLFIR